MALIYYERFDCDDQGWNRLVGAHVFHQPSHPPMRERGLFMCGISEARGHSEIERIDANFHVLLFCLGGSGELFEGDHTWPFQAGELAMQPARGQRGFRRTGNEPMHLVWFLLRDEPRWAHLNAAHCYVKPNPHGWALHDAVSMYQREAQYSNDRQSYTLVMPALELLCQQLERAVGPSEASPGWPQQLQALFNAVARELARDWPLDTLASQLHISPAHLHRLCLQHLGMPPGQQVFVLRMQKARELLASGLPVGKVASLVGYQEVASFSRRFRQYFGYSPSQSPQQKPSRAPTEGS
ncbi:AraC family transcriptional regulator [Chitinibacter sp. ZOR0017]|uniref:helix-turn-helix transcriptional regulator n=1 Tax=Chitinibacter sp. ZOR0017 TaxID=1339254 RepID=UPI00068A8029|nr:AraC family transcriptional regulator [Chitinibacter sp. ZOR0017]